LTELGEAEKLGLTPVPLAWIESGFPALSGMVMIAVCGPVEAEVKVSLNVQVPFGGTVWLEHKSLDAPQYQQLLQCP
jgi:hypothetical protein